MPVSPKGVLLFSERELEMISMVSPSARYNYPVQHTESGRMLIEGFRQAFLNKDKGAMDWFASNLDQLDVEQFYANWEFQGV